MLNLNKAISSFSVNDMQKAKEFYQNTLGLKIKEEKRGNMCLELADGYCVIVYPRDNHVHASFTILNFIVINIDKVVAELKENGIKMESYNDPGFKTDEKDIFRRKGFQIAWFKDPAGNILSVMEGE